MGSIRLPMTRSENMRRIRAKNTKPEILLRRALHADGLRYRLHIKTLPGTPDLVFAKARIVIFVHGCFWHQHHGCREASKPRTNKDYWKQKLANNIERDTAHETLLVRAGYCVLTFWECEIERDLTNIVALIRSALATTSHTILR
jgi:DNA mismatch endonuclease (patch repair protein)